MFTYIDLAYYCKRGRNDEAQKILDSGDMTMSDLEHGLHVSSSANNAAAVKMLLSHGTSVTNLAVLGACYSKSIAMFQHFLDHGWDINSPVSGNTVLRMMVNDEECTRWFLEHGADPNIASKKGYTPLGSALVHGSLATVELLDSYGAKFTAERGLICRITEQEEDTVTRLKFALDRGADPNERGEWGPPLHHTVFRGWPRKDIIECLLEYGADPEAVEGVVTAAQLAKRIGRSAEIVELLSQKTETTPKEPVSPARD